MLPPAIRRQGKIWNRAHRWPGPDRACVTGAEMRTPARR